MGFDQNDFDEVYETTPAPEKATLPRQGRVLLDERFGSAGGLAEGPAGSQRGRARDGGAGGPRRGRRLTTFHF